MQFVLRHIQPYHLSLRLRKFYLQTVNHCPISLDNNPNGQIRIKLFQRLVASEGAILMNYHDVTTYRLAVADDFNSSSVIVLIC